MNDGLSVGPGMARNQAARGVDSDLLLFVDADVAIHANAIALLREAMKEPGVVAAFGSYDDCPPAPGLASRYANLRHHFIHQRSPPFATTFWAGLGMVRREVFLACGGFSSAYGRPSIEDIELGSRLVAKGGRIRVVSSALGKHLKRWTLGQLWRTDIFQRALPWSRLIRDRLSSDQGLNGSPRERVAAVLANTTIGLLVLSLAWPWLLAAALVGALVYLFVNQAFFGFLSRKMRPLELAGAVLLHFAYHLYASQIFGWTLISGPLIRRMRWLRSGETRTAARRQT